VHSPVNELTRTFGNKSRARRVIRFEVQHVFRNQREHEPPFEDAKAAEHLPEDHAVEWGKEIGQVILKASGH